MCREYTLVFGTLTGWFFWVQIFRQIVNLRSFYDVQVTLALAQVSESKGLLVTVKLGGRWKLKALPFKKVLISQ